MEYCRWASWGILRSNDAVLATHTSAAFYGKIWENHADAVTKSYDDCLVVLGCMLSRVIWIAGGPGTERLGDELDS